MSAQPGWYDAGVPGRERWWDGTQWTAHERVADAAAAVAPSPAVPATAATMAPMQMGWYGAPGTNDVRWWDGTQWTPHRIRAGRPRPDAFAVEPVNLGFVLGILFLVAGGMQLLAALIASSAVAQAALFLVLGAFWLTGAVHTKKVQRLPAPKTAPVFDAAARPLPGEVEAAGAGWYPVAGQVTRWWTGARWSWYLGLRHGVRPGHAGPLGYRISLVAGWVMTGIGAAGVIIAVILIALSAGEPMMVGIGAIVVVAALIFVALGVFLLLLTRARRYAMILPTTPPPVR